MSKVKFIQLSAASKSDYQTKLKDAQSSYPGAIIFVTYTDDTDNNKQKQEIWANGTKYEVGGGAGNVIYGDVAVNANGVANGYTGSEGSIYVYTNEKTQTAYYWKGNKWNPFNVDAENVWFDGAVKRNKAWGKMEATSTSVVDFTERKNLVDYLKFYLLESGPVPTPTEDYNEQNVPTLQVSSNHSITGLEVSDGSTTYTAGKTYWVHAGTTVYLNQGKSIKYSNFGLSTSTKSDDVTQGGISLTGMPFGFWLTESDAEAGKIDKKVKNADGTIADTYTGNSTTQSFTVDNSYKYGKCKIQLTSTNLTYTSPTGQNDFAEVTASATIDEVYLPVTMERQFTVQDGKNGEITITGTNNNTWSATSAECIIPGVTVYVSNNESDSYNKCTYSKTIASSTQTKSPSTKTATITLQGYYPIYSNVNQSAYTTNVTEVNNTSSKYTYSFKWETKWVNGAGEAPVIIEYPSAKIPTLIIGGEDTEVGGSHTPVTQIKKIIGGKEVAYNQLKINKAFSASQEISFSLS